MRRDCQVGQEFFLSLNIFTVLPPEWIFESRDIHDTVADIYNLFISCLDLSVWLVMKAARSVTIVLRPLVYMPTSSDKSMVCWLCMCPFYFIIVVFPLFLVLQIIPLTVLVIVFSLISSFGIICFFTVAFLFLMPPLFKWKCYIYTNARMWVSLIEVLIIVIFAVFIEIHDNNYVFAYDESVLAFFAVIFFFLLYLGLYMYLMPDIRLPGGINIRSAVGYSYLGNKIEFNRLWNRFVDNIAVDLPNEMEEELNKKCNMFDDKFRKLDTIVTYWKEVKNATDTKIKEIEENENKVVDDVDVDSKDNDLKEFKQTIKETKQTLTSYEIQMSNVKRELHEATKKYKVELQIIEYETLLRELKESKQHITDMVNHKTFRSKLLDKIAHLWPKECIIYATKNEQWSTIELLKERGAK